ncbi:MAG TPA: hypothetical protein VI078_02880 [bacterium]
MVRKVARNVLAAVLLLVGIAGLFLPFIQGIAMIVLAIVVADFEAKEHLLERYRHTWVGGHLWRHHEKRKAKAAAPAPLVPQDLVPESAPPQPPRGEAASEER